MNTWHPAAFHGHNRAHSFFEGWYFKLVDASERHRFAIIPGVFLGTGGRDSHAFVQTLDGVSGATVYHRYPLEDFWAAREEFDLRIGPNRFTTHALELDIDGQGHRLAGRLHFTGVTPWPVTWRSPGIMDWYTFVPFMECYHGVLGFDHAIQGMLAIDGTAIDFHGGRGYIEKDWGKAFPRAWIWMQTNHFAQHGVSLTASVARIPWLGSAFRGFIVGLWCNGTLYRFATYTGATIEQLTVTAHAVTWHLRTTTVVGGRRQPLRLAIVAHRDGEQVDLLHAPDRTAMVQRVLESLTAYIDVRLTVGQGADEDLIFEGRGRNAGLEIGGEIATLL